MTKLAVISDCHGNYPALEAVVKAAKTSGCEYYLYCGDCLGYYYDGNKVIDTIRALPHTTIMGNHDRDFLKLLDREILLIAEYRRKYGSALEIALADVSPENVAWLRALPGRQEVTLEHKRILLCHGSPWDMNEYLYPDMPAEKRSKIFALNYDMVIMGHCHYQYAMQNQRHIILNPGSVGQARDQGGTATWAIVSINHDDISVGLMRTEYNTDEVMAQINLHDPEVLYLQQILKRGTHGI
jgi:putative phosphoesterase